MGQYYKGKKIGTCECMYYMRLEEAQKLAEQGAMDDDKISFKEYLADNQTKWRFPFPDEDNGIPKGCQYNKSFMVPSGDIEVEHSEIWFHNERKGGGGGFNISIPCPHSEEFKKLCGAKVGVSTSVGGSGEQMLNVIMEGIRDGENGDRVKKTIFECSRCESMQRFSDDDIEKLKERAKEYYPKNEDAIKIIDRIS